MMVMMKGEKVEWEGGEGRRNKEARGYMTREEMRQIVLDLDQTGALCDGTMKKQRRIHKLRVPRQRQKLALKKDIYKYIKNTL